MFEFGLTPVIINDIYFICIYNYYWDINNYIFGTYNKYPLTFI